MRRIAIVFALLSVFISGAFSAKLYLGPMKGSFGVYLASDKYRADDRPDKEKSPIHVGPSLSSITGHGQYCDESMVAGGSFDEASAGDSFEISVSCPTGFNFVSQSNNAFVRPFELIFVVNKGSAHGGTVAESKPYTISGSSSNRFTLDSEGYNAVWFDVILVMKGDLSSDGNSLIIDGKSYPLADSDDYTATVTITMKSEDANPGILSISIPFSGYFESNSAGKKEPNAMNVSISTSPAASNLDIKTLAAEQKATKVADIEMYYFIGTDDEASVHKFHPRMFLSSSNDPYVGAENEFELLHTSVGYDTPHTSYNSIGYIVSTRSYSKTDAEIPFDIVGKGVDNTPMPNFVVYHGDEYVAGEELKNSKGGTEEFIYPRRYKATAYKDINPNYNFNYNYYYWKGDIYVTLDPMSSDIMYSGIYRDTIYFHVIYD